MRFKLTLIPLDAQPEIMFGYPYAISSWIYKLIATADKQYAHFLHERGYRVPGKLKSFKDFVFSGLEIPKMAPPGPGDTAIRVKSPEIYLYVSFYVDRSAENFIAGLFDNQLLSLFDRDHRADFQVGRVETFPAVTWENTTSSKLTLTFQALSPMVVAEKNDQGMDQYLAPDHPDFGKYLAINLADKHASLEGGLQLDHEAAARLIQYRLLPDRDFRSRLLSIRENKASQTRIRGYYDFRFELTAPVAVLKVAYYSGIGKYCSAAGCGFVKADV